MTKANTVSARLENVEHTMENYKQKVTELEERVRMLVDMNTLIRNNLEHLQQIQQLHQRDMQNNIHDLKGLRGLNDISGHSMDVRVSNDDKLIEKKRDGQKTPLPVIHTSFPVSSKLRCAM